MEITKCGNRVDPFFLTCHCHAYWVIMWVPGMRFPETRSCPECGYDVRRYWVFPCCNARSA
jgi:hypothetical protein